MDNLITFSITVYTGFFAIMNPLSNMPIFLSLVGGADRKTQRTISKKATLTAFIIVTHDMQLAEKMDKIYHLVDGHLSEA